MELVGKSRKRKKPKRRKAKKSAHQGGRPNQAPAASVVTAVSPGWRVHAVEWGRQLGRRFRGRFWSCWSVVKGAFLVFLRSRITPVLPFVLSVVALVYASGPDSWKDPVARFVTILVLLVGLAEVMRIAVHGIEKGYYSATFGSIAGLISAMAAVPRKGAAPTILREPNLAVDTLLRRAKDIACEHVKLPVGERITANLLIPELDASGAPIGLIATRHDDFLPDRAHRVMLLDGPGAPKAFLSGKPQAVPDTDADPCERIHNRPYKSIGAFPICVGEPANGGVIVAVLSLDSTRAHTFSKSTVTKLNPFISPIAQLIGLALELRNQGDRDE